MATHSSVLAWRIPWTEETGGRVTVHGVTHGCFPSRREAHGEAWPVWALGSLWLTEGGCPPAARLPSGCHLAGEATRGSGGQARPVPGGGSILAVPAGSLEPQPKAARGRHACVLGGVCTRGSRPSGTPGLRLPWRALTFLLSLSGSGGRL